METAINDISNLILQARGGDTAAFGQIVRRYQGLVSGVLFSVTGDFHKSEDLAQETFLIAWNKLGELENTENPAPWLCTIARNLVNRSFRKKSVDTVHGSLGDEATSAEPEPSTELQRREQSELVWSAIGELDEKYRETLVLYYRSGQSVAEIAEATALTEETVRQRLVRARKSLKSKLELMIGDLLTDTAPGDVFTYGVMTAITGGTFSIATGTALAGTAAAGTTSTATGVGSTGASLATAVALPVATVIGSQAVAGGMLWASIRNTPTLRSRRLQVYNFLWGCQYFGWFLGAVLLLLMLLPVFLPEVSGTWFAALSQIGVMAIVMPMVMYMNYRSSVRYREMIEYELGLPGPVPRFYSFQEIRQRFYRSVISNILLLETIPLVALFPNWYSGHLDDFRLSAMMIVMMFMGLGALLFAYNYVLGKSFLDMCRDRDSFLKTPPLVKEPLKAFLRQPQGIGLVEASSKMTWLNWAPWILVIPACILMLPMLSQSESPLIPVLCLAVLVLGVPFQFYRIRKAKSPAQAMKRTVASEMILATILLMPVFIEYGFSVPELIRQTGEGDILGLFVIVYVGMTLVFLPVQLLNMYKEFRRERQQFHSGRAEAIREAVERFDPTVFIDDESVSTPEPLPKRWIGVCVLYGIAVVGVICLGLQFPSPAGYCQRGNSLRHDHPHEAIKNFDAAIAWSPRYAKAFYSRGSAWGHIGFDLRMKDKPEEVERAFALALKDCGEAIRLAPRSQEAWEARARIHWYREDWQAAVADYTEALRFKPDVPQKMFHDSARMRNLKARAECEEELGNFSVAEADYTEAIQICRDSIYHESTAYNISKRGDFYARIGNSEKAIADYDEAISLNNSDAWLKQKRDEERKKLEEMNKTR